MLYPDISPDHLLHLRCQLQDGRLHLRGNLKHLATHVALQRQQDGTAQVAHGDKRRVYCPPPSMVPPRPFAWRFLKKLPPRHSCASNSNRRYGQSAAPLSLLPRSHDRPGGSPRRPACWPHRGRGVVVPCPPQRGRLPAQRRVGRGKNTLPQRRFRNCDLRRVPSQRMSGISTSRFSSMRERYSIRSPSMMRSSASMSWVG